VIFSEKFPESRHPYARARHERAAVPACIGSQPDPIYIEHEKNGENWLVLRRSRWLHARFMPHSSADYGGRFIGSERPRAR
jgi:hypothetical protein